MAGTNSSTAAELFASTAAPTREVLQNTDWTATLLGPVERWSESLQAAIKTVLPSRVPMMLWWGPQLVQLYNDAAAPVIGSKHPTAIGQRAAECYAEAWSELEPLTETVLTGKGATFSRDLFLPYHRHGYVEETYWTFSYSPVQDGDRVSGVLVSCMETTRQVLAERRLGLLHRLGDISGAEAATPRGAVQAAVGIIEQSRADVPFALAHLLDDSGQFLHRVGSFGVEPDTVLDWSVIPGPDDKVPSWLVASSHEAVVVEDINAKFGAVFEPSVLGDAVPDDAMILPLHNRAAGTVVGALALGINPYREFDEEYRAFFRSVARQVSTALTDSLAVEAQRRRAEKLAELDAAKTRFLQNVSHELRTPLTLILASVRAIRAEGRAYPPDVDAAERSALRLLRLVGGLLTVAQAEADELHLLPKPTDLAEVTADVASMFRAAVERAGIEFDVRADRMSRSVTVDPEMWIRIVANLLSNAVKFTFTGSIRVVLSEVGEEAVLTVADTGVGIPPDELSRIFDRFHQVPGTIARSREGAGIGLSLVADLVAAHRGTVGVDSTVGTGSCFTVRMPVDEATAVPRSVDIRGTMVEAFRAEVDSWLDDRRTEPADEPPFPSADAGHVLLVEDNADMRAYLVRLLRSDGWRVSAVADAGAALRVPAAPDLVLSDVMLPGTDGLQLTRMLRRLPATARVPVVLLTARAGSESAAEGLAAGADDYVVKPFDPAELLARVRVHFELARLREFAVAQAENESANLRVALASNRQIGAALGILMYRHKISSDDSFAQLRAVSQRLNRKLRDVADEVVLTGELPA